jgi:hypothetical protein
MRRKRLMLITTIFAVFAMTSYAFAANQGFVNVTSEPVAQGTSCAKAGGFSIAFDSGTTLTAGDQITIDLDLGVTLCKDIDLLIAPFASANGSGWGKGTIPTSGSPVVAPNGNLTSVDSGVVFLVTGNSGSARITVDVMGPDANGDGTFGDDEAGDPTPNSVTVTGGTADDKLIINFLDQHTNSVDFTTQEGIWSNTKKRRLQGSRHLVAEYHLYRRVHFYRHHRQRQHGLQGRRIYLYPLQPADCTYCYRSSV